ncbi:MAG: GNAT family N-acetyltransferase [Knoellia sp.]
MSGQRTAYAVVGLFRVWRLRQDDPVLTLVEVPFVDPRVQELVAEVQAHYVVIYGTPDESPVDPREFASPRGHFVLGVDDLVDGEPVAMGGWRWRPDLSDRFDGDRVAEVKRMFVPARARGRGHASRVLAFLEASAWSEGVERLVLETGLVQPEAIGLYESAGYEPVAPFGHYAESELVRCFGKDLRQR